MVISTTTRTCQELARGRFGSKRVFYCPLDLPWAVRAYLNALKPRMLVLAETEFWPNLLSGCFRRRIPVVVVNARISDCSWPRSNNGWLRAGLYGRLPLLTRLGRVLAQSDDGRGTRVKAIGLAVYGAGCRLRSEILNLTCVPVEEAPKLPKVLRTRERLSAIIGLCGWWWRAARLEGEEDTLLEAWPQSARGRTTAGTGTGATAL